MIGLGYGLDCQYTHNHSKKLEDAGVAEMNTKFIVTKGYPMRNNQI